MTENEKDMLRVLPVSALIDEIERLRAMHGVYMKIVTGRNDALEEDLVRLTAERDALRTALDWTIALTVPTKCYSIV